MNVILSPLALLLFGNVFQTAPDLDGLGLNVLFQINVYFLIESIFVEGVAPLMLLQTDQIPVYYLK